MQEEPGLRDAERPFPRVPHRSQGSCVSGRCGLPGGAGSADSAPGRSALGLSGEACEVCEPRGARGVCGVAIAALYLPPCEAAPWRGQSRRGALGRGPLADRGWGLEWVRGGADMGAPPGKQLLAESGAQSCWALEHRRQRPKGAFQRDWPSRFERALITIAAEKGGSWGGFPLGGAAEPDPEGRKALLLLEARPETRSQERRSLGV